MSAADDVFAALAAAFGPALGEAAGANGRGVQPVSLALDMAARPAPGELTSVETRVDRSTRTLVFVSGEARGAGGRLLAIAQAVYRVTAATAA